MYRFLGVFFLCVVLTAGCGAKYDEPDKAVTDSVELFDDGSMTAVISGSFDKDYYKEDELVSMVEKELSLRNGSISLTGHEKQGDRMILSFKFDNWRDYGDYASKVFFSGSIQEAYDFGYDFNRSLKTVGSDKVIGKEDIMKMADHNMMIFEGAETVKGTGKIKYYSQELKLIDNKTVQSVSDGVYYIIY